MSGTVVVVVVVVVLVVVVVGAVVAGFDVAFAGTVVVVVVVVVGTTTGIHCAYKVTARAGITKVALASNDVPDPSAAVFQRLKVKLGRVKSADATVTDEKYCTDCVVGRVPEPPLTL